MLWEKLQKRQPGEPPCSRDGKGVYFISCSGHSPRQRVGEINKAENKNDDSKIILKICGMRTHTFMSMY